MPLGFRSVRANFSTEINLPLHTTTQLVNLLLAKPQKGKNRYEVISSYKLFSL